MTSAFHIAQPYVLLLLLPVFALVWVVYRRRARQALLFAPTERIPSPGWTPRTMVARAAPAMFLAGLLLMVLALARPQTVLSRIRSTTDALSIGMALDVSGSMEALDMSDIAQRRIVKERTRLDAVKEVFSDFVQKRPNDLICLVTFGGYASTRVPLTTDHNALLHVLKGVEIPRGAFDNQGNLVNRDELLTAIGDGLMTTAARLRAAPTKSKIIVLLSDGEQTVEDKRSVQPEEALQAVRKLGFRIYTIGVGSNGEAPFAARDVFGRPVYSFRQVSMDEPLLRRLAEETRGRYFNVRDRAGLEDALKEIDRLEKTRVTNQVFGRYREWFPWFLVPGLFLVAFAATGNMAVTRRVI